MWTREPLPNYLATLTVNDGLTVNGQAIYNNVADFNQDIRVNQARNPGLYYGVPAGNSRTTFGLQVQPRMANNWTTTAGTNANALVASRYPGGWVHLAGILSNAVPASRANGVYCFDFNQTVFASTFSPLHEIHIMADGKSSNIGFGAAFTLGTNGNAFCYNLNTAAGSQSYYLNVVYNRYTRPGLYEGSGGYSP